QAIVLPGRVLTDVPHSQREHRPGPGTPPIALIFLEDSLMPDAVKVGFVPLSAAVRGILVVFCDDSLKFGEAARKALGTTAGLVGRAAATSQFKGKSGAVLDILEPQGLKVSRLIVVGTGKQSAITENDFLKFGGVIAGKLRAGSEAVTVVADLPD